MRTRFSALSAVTTTGILMSCAEDFRRVSTFVLLVVFLLGSMVLFVAALPSLGEYFTGSLFVSLGVACDEESVMTETNRTFGKNGAEVWWRSWR